MIISQKYSIMSNGDVMNGIRRKKFSIISALIISLLLNIGFIYSNNSSFFAAFTSMQNVFSVIISYAFWSLILLGVIYGIYTFIDSIKNKNRDGSKSLFRRRPFISMFILTLGISIIYFIAFYPGIVTWDGFWQLDMFYGIREMSNHHPAGLSYLMGTLVEIGRFFIDDNFGIALFTIIEMIINALIYAYTIKIISRLKIPNILFYGAIIFYSSFPLLSLNSVTYIKDTLFYLIALFLFVFQYYHFVIAYDASNKRKFLYLTGIYILLILLRNTGIYITIVSLVCLLIYYRKENRDIFAGLVLVFGVALIFNISYNTIIYSVLDVNHSSIREMMSIPLQQTARYLKYYPDDLTDTEIDVLNNLFSVELEEVGELYNPNKSDPVKWKFKSDPTVSELIDYLKVWWTMFLRHPDVYIDATLNNIYGYFYPGLLNSIDEGLGFFEIEDNERVNTGYLDIHFNDQTNWLRNIIYNMSYLLSEIPIIGKIYYCATYTWTLILVTVYMLYRKYKRLLVYCAQLYMGIIVCIISPLNAHMRYLAPVAICIPVLLAFLYYERTHEIPEKS